MNIITHVILAPIKYVILNRYVDGMDKPVRKPRHPKNLSSGFPARNDINRTAQPRPLTKWQSHIHDFGPGRATVHSDLSNRGASALFVVAP